MHTTSTWSFLCYRNDAARNLIYPQLSALSKQGMMNLRRPLQTTSPCAHAGNANAWPIQGHTNALAWNTSMPYSPAGHPLTSPNRDWMHDRERRAWEAPNQAINPVATLVMSADFAAALAKALAAASKPLKKLR